MELDYSSLRPYGPGKYDNMVDAFVDNSDFFDEDAGDVLYSLVSDASAADETFDDWCANFGMDTDSRKAETMYRECVDTGIRLRRLVGGAETLSKLQDIFQGY